MTAAEVLFDLGQEFGIDLPIEVIGELGKKLRAVQD